MGAIKGKDTKPEVIIRRHLHRNGFRFRLHVTDLPGKPDIVLPKWRAVVEVRGCFWHRHEGCAFATAPGTRPEFWSAKFAANVARDRRNDGQIKALGWRLAIVWECALKRDQGRALDDLVTWITSDSPDQVID